jgi:hypothetical protein
MTTIQTQINDLLLQKNQSFIFSLFLVRLSTENDDNNDVQRQIRRTAVRLTSFI